MKNAELKQLQKIELDILKEVVRVCDKEKIQYFLDSGTALGAVRHQGFIPWDDDIDIGMTRANYETFLKIAPNELGSDYFLQTVKTDSFAPYYYAKVRKNNTTFMEWNKRNLHMHHGVYIDIFPYDNLPDDPDVRRRFHKTCHKLYMLWLIRTIPDRVDRPKKSLAWAAKALARRLLHILTLPIPRQWLYRQMDQKFQLYNDRDTKALTSLAYTVPCLFQRRNLFPLGKGTFEGVDFSLPHDTSAYLSGLYGDYMQLPPEEDRVCHMTNILHFNLSAADGPRT